MAPVEIGEQRVEEHQFRDTLFPDFDRRQLWRACEIYASRDRRYGGAVPNPEPALANGLDPRDHEHAGDRGHAQ